MSPTKEDAEEETNGRRGRAKDVGDARQARDRKETAGAHQTRYYRVNFEADATWARRQAPNLPESSSYRDGAAQQC